MSGVVDPVALTAAIAGVLAAALLPFAFLVATGWPSRTEVARWGRGYDNRQPRASADRLTGWRQRAHFAQLNGHEAFAPFAAGVILACLAGVGAARLQTLVALFLGFRTLYGFFYVADRGTLRSVAWWGGALTVVALYLFSLAA